MPWVDQVISIFAATKGYLDEYPISKVSKFEKEFLNFIKTSKADLHNSIEKADELDEKSEIQLKSALDEFIKNFS